MKKKLLPLFIIALFIFTPFIKVSANDVGIVGKIATFTETDAAFEFVPGSTNMENYINTKKNEFLVALSGSVGTIDTSKSNLDPTTLFSTTSPYKYAVIGDVSSSYQMIEGTLTQTYTVNYTSYDVLLSGHNNIWTTSGGQIAVLYENRNNEQPDLDGNHWASNGLVVDYAIGDDLTVKAQANENYKFVGWYVSNVEKGAEYYFNDKLVSTSTTYTYKPNVTTVDGIDEPINYLTAVFKEDKATKTYTIDDERGNQIIFTDDEGIVYVFNSTDILNITDEELAEIASQIGKTVEEVTEMGNKAIESAKKAAEGKGTLIGLYDFSVFDGNNFKEQTEGGFKIRIKMTDEMKKYDTFSIGFMKDDGTLDTLITLTRNGDYLEGTLPHLSTYAIIGNKVEVTKTNNPPTRDNIFIYVTLLGLSLLGLYAKKKIEKKIQ